MRMVLLQMMKKVKIWRECKEICGERERSQKRCGLLKSMQSKRYAAEESEREREEVFCIVWTSDECHTKIFGGNIFERKIIISSIFWTLLLEEDEVHEEAGAEEII